MIPVPTLTLRRGLLDIVPFVTLKTVPPFCNIRKSSGPRNAIVVGMLRLEITRTTWRLLSLTVGIVIVLAGWLGSDDEVFCNDPLVIVLFEALT